MKRSELIREIREAAKVKGLRFTSIREGRHGELFQVGATKVEVPRHKEIGPKGAYVVRAALEDEFGKGWWR